MPYLAVQALASGGHGERRIASIAVVVIVVALVAGWIIYKRRTRRDRGQS